MKATLKLEDGREIEVEVKEEDFKKKDEWPKEDDGYWFVHVHGNVYLEIWEDNEYKQGFKDIGNLFKSKEEAEDTVRALKLIQAVKVRRRELNGDWVIDWSGGNKSRWCIWFNWYKDSLEDVYHKGSSEATIFGYYKDGESTMRVIKEFKDELIWYFKEYLPAQN